MEKWRIREMACGRNGIGIVRYFVESGGVGGGIGVLCDLLRGGNNCTD